MLFASTIIFDIMGDVVQFINTFFKKKKRNNRNFGSGCLKRPTGTLGFQ